MYKTRTKIIAVAAAAALSTAMGLTACGTSAPANDNGETSVAEKTSEEVGLANPWHDVSSAQEAAEGAGVDSFKVPSAGTKSAEGAPIDINTFRYMNSLAEGNGTIGAGVITVRKGLLDPEGVTYYDPPDVSGDYNEYGYSWSESIDGMTVECSGTEQGLTQKAIWSTDNFCYSIVVQAEGDDPFAYGLSADDLIILVGSIS